MYDLLLPVSFTTEMFSKFIHVIACITTLLFLWLSNIPLYGYYVFVSISSSIFGLFLLFVETFCCMNLCLQVFY